MLTSRERISKTMSFQEADRVPFALSLTMHGAKELGMSLPEYYAKTENVVEGQIRMQERYGHDVLLAYLYTALDYQIFGGREIVVNEEGPFNAGPPIITELSEINELEKPDIRASTDTKKLLSLIEGLRERKGRTVPIMGAVTSPFSLPVMQLGFETYLELLFQGGPLFWKLMEINAQFCLELANLQYQAGADVVAYIDPVLSPEIVSEELQEYGFKTAEKVLPMFSGDFIIHFASARMEPSLDRLLGINPAGLGISFHDDLPHCKRKCSPDTVIVGNLNALEMVSWSQEEALKNVRDKIQEGAPGGGFILSDNHGEIPFQVSEDTIATVAEAVKTYGQYP
ncbi:MAG: uroporphyrinogen decarboxylase family protein [Spirochaetia bacterium]